jgi:hypothetical protein
MDMEIWRGWPWRSLGEDGEGIVVEDVLFLLVFGRLEFVGVQAVGQARPKHVVVFQ